MTYAHNAEADFASSELARQFADDPALCYPNDQLPESLSGSASHEPSSSGWPRADGVVNLLEAGGNERSVAVEYKRPEEGIHGLLTAMGQAVAYVHKGYHGVAIVIPAVYPTLADAASYVSSVLDHSGGNPAIGVFAYDEPDPASATPFRGRLHSVRPLNVFATPAESRPPRAGSQTQWVHMREGSTTRDGFLGFLQAAKQLSAGAEPPPPVLPAGLVDAVARLAPDEDPAAYLAHTSDDRFLSRVWRAFWFGRVATPDVLTPWVTIGSRFETPDAYTRVARDDGRGLSQIFEGRANGLKETLVGMLNDGAIHEERAWEMFVGGVARQGRPNTQGVRQRAHSYREDMDSALSQLGWIEDDGHPTEFGWKYTTVCERYGGANSDAAKEYVGATLLKTGKYASFLHYVHRISEDYFRDNPLAFTNTGEDGQPVFDEDSYWDYLAKIEDALTNDLRVMRKVSRRNRPRRRTEFQAELTLLRRYGFVDKARYRLGVGIPIHWEKVIQALDVEL